MYIALLNKLCLILYDLPWFQSLETFLEMLEKAESNAKGRGDERRDRRGRGRDDSRDRSRKFIRPSKDSDDEERSSSSSRYQSSSRRDRENRHRGRDRSRDRQSGWRKKQLSPERNSRRRRSPSEGRRRRESRSPPKHEATTTAPPHSRPALQKQRSASRSASPKAEESEPMEVEKDVPKVLSDKEMNELNAKLLKAEMFGNTVSYSCVGIV